MPRDEREDFKEMELWEHLAELRTRLMRSVIYLVVGLIAGWIVYNPLRKILFAPLMPFINGDPNNRIVYRTFTGPFMLQLQVSLIAGLTFAIPAITFELWGFIAPGLTRTERRVCQLVFPLSLFFFFLGIGTGYAIMGPSVGWFMDFFKHDPTHGALLQDPAVYLIFMVKMLVAFGICFQLPLVLMALSYIGIVSSKLLAAQWRLGVVLCAVIAAVATPGGDPFSMIMMGVPLALLYLASIALCRVVEGFKARQEKRGAQMAYDSA